MRRRARKDRPRVTFAYPLSVDALEARAYLSTTPLRPFQVARAAAHARAQDAQVIRAQTLAFAPPTTPPAVTLDDQVSFAYGTVKDGRRIAYSPQVRVVGLDFAKLGVSEDTRKVGAAYLDAALRGDGKDLERLGSSPLVKKVGNDFQSLSESMSVQRLGSAFEKFGKSVAKEFNKLFGLD